MMGGSSSHANSSVCPALVRRTATSSRCEEVQGKSGLEARGPRGATFDGLALPPSRPFRAYSPKTCVLGEMGMGFSVELVRDEEGARAEGTGNRENLGGGSLSKNDSVSRCELKSHPAHHAVSVGATFRNFTLVRGSAIMGATASRHAA